MPTVAVSEHSPVMELEPELVLEPMVLEPEPAPVAIPLRKRYQARNPDHVEWTKLTMSTWSIYSPE